jgi:ankyrin repeat protein
MILDIYEAAKRDANINEQNNKNKTVLHLAAKEGFHELISRLVLLGSDLSIKVSYV